MSSMRFAKAATLVIIALLTVSSGLLRAQSVASFYVPINPCMLYDARVSPGWMIAPGEVFHIDVRGNCGIPEEANSVTLILVGYGQTTYGFVKLWGSDVNLSTAVTSMDVRPTNADSSLLTIRLCYPLSGCHAMGDLHGVGNVTTWWIAKAVGYTLPISASASSAQMSSSWTCPAATPTFTPTCATFNPSRCPTQAECDNGWLQFAPSSPMTNIPYQLTRNSCTDPHLCSPGADGRIDTQFCYTDTSPNQPKCDAIGVAVAASIPLSEWCTRLKSLPMPAACASQPCGTRYPWVGLCGVV